MSDENRYLEEENTARLISAGFGPQARPGRQVRAATLQRLRSQLRTRHAASLFPEHVLCLLIGALMLMTVWPAMELIGANLPVGGKVSSLVCVAALSLNLASVPIAGGVVVIRRRNVRPTQEDAA